MTFVYCLHKGGIRLNKLKIHVKLDLKHRMCSLSFAKCKLKRKISDIMYAFGGEEKRDFILIACYEEKGEND